MTLPS